MSPESPSLREEVSAWADQVQDVIDVLRARRYDVLEIDNLVKHLTETLQRLRALHYSLRLYEPTPYAAPITEPPAEPRELARAYLSHLKGRYGYTDQAGQERPPEPRSGNP